MHPHPGALPAGRLKPRGCLQAVEFEQKGFGHLSIEGRDVVYMDAFSGAGLMRVRFTSSREARLQLAFYRSTYEGVQARRNAQDLDELSSGA